MGQSREKRIERLNIIAERLREKFDTVILNNEECFVLPSGVIIQVNALGGEYNALVIGFAENIDEAKRNQFDDGSLYYMNELDTDEMFNKMMKEIENEM